MKVEDLKVGLKLRRILPQGCSNFSKESGYAQLGDIVEVTSVWEKHTESDNNVLSYICNGQETDDCFLDRVGSTFKLAPAWEIVE